MIFIHEIDIKEKQYKEIITLNPYLALHKALETAHDDNLFVTIRTTGSYYDILKKEERDLRPPFKQIKDGKKQSIIISESDIDGNLADFCKKLYENEWYTGSKSSKYDRSCAFSKGVIVWFRQKPTMQNHTYHYDVFKEVYTLLEGKQWKDTTSFKKSLMTIDKKVLKNFVARLTC